MKKILIIGVTGQDGSILAKKLISKKFEVIGTYRRGSDTGLNNKLWRLSELGIKNQIQLEPLELNDSFSIQKIINKNKPDTIFCLAGNSYVQDSFEFPQYTIQTNVTSTLNILESVKLIDKNIKVFFASSSEIFDSTENHTKNENSKMSPSSPYGISKLTILKLVDLYRKTYRMNLSTGIMFNHESEFRPRSYVTRKLTFNLARLKLFGGNSVQLGNINSSRDWSSAFDFVDAMFDIISNNNFNDFVLSSGKLTSLRSIIVHACEHLEFEPIFVGDGYDEKCIDSKTGLELISINKKYYREMDTPGMVGDSSKLKKEIGWTPEISIEKTIEKMIDKDINRLKTK